MHDRSEGAGGHLREGNVPRNCPLNMSPDSRLREVASLLAAGFLRHWLRESPDWREKELDFLRTSSEVCPEPTSAGETE